MTREEKAMYDLFLRWSDPDHFRERQRRSREKNRDKKRIRDREYIALNPHQNRDRAHAWRADNRERHNANRRKNYAKRMATDPSFRLEQALRSRLFDTLKGNRKSAKTMRLLGCSIENLWIYLESKFSEGMSRENYGKLWEVDHIMPCAIFDLSKPEHQRRCFHFSNLQPLWTEKNRHKSAKVLSNQFELL